MDSLCPVGEKWFWSLSVSLRIFFGTEKLIVVLLANLRKWFFVTWVGRQLRPFPACFFSMKWNATIIVTFFQSTRTDQKSSWKFYKILFHQIAPFSLANWTKKVFPVFPRNIPYWARPKGPPLIFFGTVRLFFGIFSPKGPPLIFFAVLRQYECWKIPKGLPFHFFRHCEIFFLNFFLSKGSPLKFLWYFTTDWVFKHPKGSLLQLRQKCRQFQKCPPFSAPGARGPLGPFFGFSIFEYCKLTLGSPFAIFEPWIWLRLGPVPACF